MAPYTSVSQRWRLSVDTVSSRSVTRIAVHIENCALQIGYQTFTSLRRLPISICLTNNIFLQALSLTALLLMFTLGSTVQIIIQVYCATSEEPRVGLRSPE